MDFIMIFHVRMRCVLIMFTPLLHSVVPHMFRLIPFLASITSHSTLLFSAP